MSLIATFLRSALLLIIIVSAASASAQPADSIFPDQRLVYEKKQDNVAYLLTLSPIKKVHSEYEADNEMLVKARLRARTYEIGHPYKLESAWQEVQSYMGTKPATLVFECGGLDCGNSNAWANQRFNVKQLYGLDQRQHYQVWQTGSDRVANFEVFYMVERGNRRVYFQRDTLAPLKDISPLGPSEEVVASRFYKNRELVLSGLKFEQGNIFVDKNILEAYAKAFNQQSFRRLAVVAYDAFSGTEDEREQRAEAYAQVVKRALIDLGVRESRLSVEGHAANPADDKSYVVVKIKTR